MAVAAALGASRADLVRMVLLSELFGVMFQSYLA
jgi:hypothetical protein